jgi:hypothetical protein
MCNTVNRLKGIIFEQRTLSNGMAAWPCHAYLQSQNIRERLSQLFNITHISIIAGITIIAGNNN